jgi:hypothetical protein
MDIRDQELEGSGRMSSIMESMVRIDLGGSG